MSRPRFVPTDEKRKNVRSMAAYGIKQEDIAIAVGALSPKTLRKHFPEELRCGAIEANAQVAQTLYQMAISGKCPAATIFWAKTRMGWREIQIVETRPAAIPDFVVMQDKEAA
jgi:hypothetical protein